MSEDPRMESTKLTPSPGVDSGAVNRKTGENENDKRVPDRICAEALWDVPEPFYRSTTPTRGTLHGPENQTNRGCILYRGTVENMVNWDCFEISREQLSMSPNFQNSFHSFSLILSGAYSLFVETIPPTIRVNKLPVTSIFTTKYSFHLMNNRLFPFPVPLL
ncbi:hypothetical protein KQX54_017387 [Cotesia glomerata]|uniref:Uncharacterized protein n=1 Tax=Cotesia glomerata TaxID=32391 RepID=A0AAV7I5C8_COTGL|nr:hypothetical protein KQX54_017387 [Cotesia glomerata]